jgi:aspartate/methionine/tyrosine aminotransferase
MRERTVKIGSAGKMFGLTGWKVGWLCAAPALTHALTRAHQFLTFTTPPNLQTAVAWGLENAGDWFRDMPLGLERSRDRMAEGLQREGFVVLPADGTYFLCIDLKGSGLMEGDRDFCLRSVKEAGVAAIPTAFVATYGSGSPVIAISPPMPWVTWSKPGRFAYGPSWPKPEMLASTMRGFTAFSDS